MIKLQYDSASHELYYMKDTHIEQLTYPATVIAISILTGEHFEMEIEHKEEAFDLMVDEWELYVP
jgi:hypothetical protein